MAKNIKEYIIVYTVPCIHNVFATLVKANRQEEAREQFFTGRVGKTYYKIIEIRQTSPFDWRRDAEMEQLELEDIHMWQ